MTDCTRNYRALAAAILLQAIKDVQRCQSGKKQADALDFLASPAALWLCRRLDIHDEAFHGFLATLESGEAGAWSETGTWLSVEEAAKAGGYHPNALRRKLRENLVPGAAKRGRTWLIPRMAIPAIQRLRQRQI